MNILAYLDYDRNTVRVLATGAQTIKDLLVNTSHFYEFHTNIVPIDIEFPRKTQVNYCLAKVCHNFSYLTS